jgi:hypothetical protein
VPVQPAVCGNYVIRLLARGYAHDEDHLQPVGPTNSGSLVAQGVAAFRLGAVFPARAPFAACPGISQAMYRWIPKL